MIDEVLLKKHIESGLSDEEIMRSQIAAERAKIAAEADRRQREIKLAEARAARRIQTVSKLIELDAAAEAIAAEHAEIFRRRQEMLKESARAEGKTRAKWYEIFLEFSTLARELGGDPNSQDAELKKCGARCDAARQSMIYLPASDAFQGFHASGELRDDPPPAERTEAEMNEIFQLAAAVRAAQNAPRSFGDYGDIAKQETE